MRRHSYTHCECGVMVRMAKMDGDDEASRALKNAGGVAFGGVCPSCKAACTVTIIPAADDPNRPRVQLLTAQ